MNLKKVIDWVIASLWVALFLLVFVGALYLVSWPAEREVTSGGAEVTIRYHVKVTEVWVTKGNSRITAWEENGQYSTVCVQMRRDEGLLWSSHLCYDYAGRDQYTVRAYTADLLKEEFWQTAGEVFDFEDDGNLPLSAIQIAVKARAEIQENS